jgi:hypothetical protein
MRIDAITEAAAEYGFDPVIVHGYAHTLLFERPNVAGWIIVSPLDKGPRRRLTHAGTEITHRDPVAALHALMALCGIARVEVAA